MAYTYDPAYRVQTLTDGNTGGTTTYTYDSDNNLIKTSLPRAGEVGQPATFDTIAYTHDATGAVLSRTDGKGVQTNFEYLDPDGRLSAIKYPADATQNVDFTYDIWGRPATRTDAAGKVTYTISDADYLTTLGTQYKNPTTGVLMASHGVTYTYKPDGARATVNVGGSVLFTYTYDALNRWNTVKDSELLLTTTWSYNDDDSISQMNLPGVARTEYAYNPAGELVSVLNRNGALALISQFGHTTDATKKLSYDGAGNLLKVTASFPAETPLNGVTNFEYDTKNQLTREQSLRGGVGAYDHSFVYNAAGNATTFKSTAGLTYNTANQRTGTGYVYDGNGNATTYGGATLAYDQQNRLTQYNASGGALVLKAGYRSDGLRAWKEDSAGVRTFFIYDGTNVVAEYSAANSMSAWQEWGPTGLVARRKILANNNAGSTLPVTSYYQYDSRGNLVHKLSWLGVVEEDYGHTAYGERVAEGSTVTFGRSDGPVGYGGQFGYHTDPETGLILCGFRYYDPKNGRWVTRDPIGYRGGVNIYSYVGNNPIAYADSRGLAANRSSSPGSGGSWISHIPLLSTIYYHYSRQPNTSGQMRPGGYVTDDGEMTGPQAEMDLGIPRGQGMVYRHEVNIEDGNVSCPAEGPVVMPSGANEWYLPNGSPPGSMGPPMPTPSYYDDQGAPVFEVIEGESASLSLLAIGIIILL